MADSSDDFYYQHFIYSSSDDGSYIIMFAAHLIHGHNEKQRHRFKSSVKGRASLDRNKEVGQVQLYADYFHLTSHYTLSIFSVTLPDLETFFQPHYSGRSEGLAD